jgi:hypothetical protein
MSKNKEKNIDYKKAHELGAEIVQAKKAREENAIKFQKEINAYKQDVLAKNAEKIAKRNKQLKETLIVKKVK